MKINIKYTNLTSTSTLEKFIQDKIGSLAKFIQRWEKSSEAEADIEIARTSKHHNKGDVFHAEINLKLPGLFIRAEHDGEDAHEAIEKVKDKAKREITKIKDKKLPR